MTFRSVILLIGCCGLIESSYAKNKDPGISYMQSQAEAQVNTMVREQVNGLNIPDWLKRTEFEFNKQNLWKLRGYTILTVQPLYCSEDDCNTLFVQGRINSQTRFGEHSWRTTANGGLGYRRLAANDTVLWGINAFYDYEMPHKHRQSGFGAEVRTTAGELNANLYIPESKWITAHRFVRERAVRSWDIELGIPLPYTPWIKLYAKRLHLDYITRPKENGYSYSVEINPIRFVRIEWGTIRSHHFRHQPFNHHRKRYSSFIKVQFSFGFDGIDNLEHSGFFDKVPYQLACMREKTLDKVRRNNTIVLERVHITPPPVVTSGTVSINVVKTG